MQELFRKILVLSVSAGAGHVRAADAVVFACQSEGIAREIVHLDTLEYTSKAVRTLYTKAYFDMARTAPDVVGWVYGFLDKPWKNEKKMRALERLNVALFMRLLKRIQPDLVINTHFLPADIISYLRRKEQLNCKSAVVITDYDAHAMWLNRDVDLYCTACEEESVYLQELGIAPQKVVTTGIPIDPRFALKEDKREVRKEMGLKLDVPVVLVSCGGFDADHVVALVESLRKMKQKAQVLVMCGRNEDLLKRIGSIKSVPEHLHIQAIGYTTLMHRYMSAADVLVGKPGGLTSSEALAKGLAMVIVAPIPGQEERNSDYLLENGAALKCNNVQTLAYKVDGLLEDRQKLQRLQTNALSVAQPDAALKVVRSLSVLASGSVG